MSRSGSQPGRSERRLAAVLFTDIVGYTALMAEDEAKGLQVRARHRETVQGVVARYGGECNDESGDEILATFSSSLGAVNCALAIQEALRGDDELRVRIGIHLGDVVFEDGRVYGDGVNLAARVRPTAAPGGICVSEEVWHSVRNQPSLEATPLGPHAFKNVGRPVSVFRVSGAPMAPQETLEPEPGRPRRRLWVLGIAAVLGLLITWLAMPPSTGPVPGLPTAFPGGAPPTAIAVLPFDDMSPDSGREYFADGLSEEIIHALARFEDLHVVARTSSFAFRGQSEDVREIGARLSVGTVIEGSVRLADERVRITAQLIDVSSGFHVWSRTFDRRLEDFLAVQEEIAVAIVESLPVRRDRRTQSSRRAPGYRAYELFLRGHAAFDRRTDSSIREAARYLEQAIALHPEYAAAHAELSRVYLSLGRRAQPNDPVLIAQAERAARGALAIDGRSAEAHAALGDVYRARGAYATAEEEYERALALNSGFAPVYEQYAHVLAMRGAIDEALSAIERALELDPLSPLIHRQAGRYTLYSGQPARAVELLWRALELNPEDFSAPGLLWIAYHELGDPVRAREALLLHARRPLRWGLRLAARALGERRLLRVLFAIEGLRTGDACAGNPDFAAQLLAFLGERERMFACLERSLDQRMSFLVLNPLYDPYRGDPRFQAIAERLLEHVRS